MTCTRCGTENPAGRKFCGACGARLAKLCPSCGAANEPQFAFCGECGSELTPTAEPTQTPTIPTQTTPSTERRLVSALPWPRRTTPNGVSGRGSR